jgi:hypothetical protein
LQDLNNVDVLESNNAIILQKRGDVKRMLKEYQGVLKDHHKVDVLEPNSVFILRRPGDIKKMLEDY